MLLCEKYAPLSLERFAGNRDAVFRARQWGLSFSINKCSKPLLIFGPSGCGKSALASSLAASMEWSLIRIDPPLEGQKEKWEANLLGAFSNSPLFGGISAVLIEDIDTWAALKAQSAISSILPYLSNPRLPIILTATDAYDRSLSSMRSHCELLPLKAINSADIESVLLHISKAEKLELPYEEIHAIASNANGDLRAAICDLQARNAHASRERSKLIFDQVRVAMRSQTLASARSIQVPISERDTFKLYLAENLPAEFIGVHERAAAFARLSRADVFDGRIKSRQYWGYLRYSSDLLFWGIASIRSKPPSGFVPYAFPSFIQKMGISKSRRSLRKALCNKIAKKLHTTTRRAIDFLPLLSLQGHIHPASLPSLASYYELDEEEVAGLLELSPISAQKNLPAKKQSLAKKGK